MKLINYSATLLFCVFQLFLSAQNVIHVPGDWPNIQTAILFSNDGDTVLVASGTYTGNGNVDIELLGKAIVVTSQEGFEHTIIDCEDNGKGFFFKSGEDNSTIIDGFTIRNSGGWAQGAIHCQFSTSPLIRNCIIENCSWGVVCDNNTYPTLENCIIQNSDNRGLYYSNNTNTAIIRNCIIRDNTTLGIWHNGSSSGNLILENTLIYNNGSNGIYGDFRGNIFIKNSVIYGNSSNQGGGVFAEDDVVLSVTNSILWNNSASSFPNFYSLNAEVIHSNIGGGWPGTGNINEDPLFVDPNNGDFRLLDTSPCLDAGDNSVIDFPTDFDGNIRIWDGDGDATPVVDMGAYEFGAPIYQQLGISMQPVSVSVCEGEEATFSVAATGILPTYQWYNDGEEIVGATDSTLTLSNVSPGDEGNYTCVVSDFSGMNIISQPASLTVAPAVTASVQISANVTVCEDALITFTATPTNGGNMPSFQWQLNGNNVGTNSNEFTIDNLKEGDEITCLLTSSEDCVSNNPASSNSLFALPKPIPVSDSNSPVCLEATLELYSDGGFSYNWAGPNGFTSNEQNPSIASVEMMAEGLYEVTVTGENGCQDTSQTNVDVLDLPNVDLNLPFTEVCQDNSQIALSGGSPAGGVYSGNGVIGNDIIGYFLIPQSVVVGTHEIFYHYADPNTGCENGTSSSINVNALPDVTLPFLGEHCENIDTVILQGGAPAGGTYSGNFVTNGFFQPSLAGVGNHFITYTYTDPVTNCSASSTATIQVEEAVDPTISIASSNNEICPGESVTFDVMATNEGSDPLYQWFVDGVLTATTSGSWTIDDLENGQEVFCILITSEICVLSNMATSNTISVTVFDLPEPNASSNSPLCEGETLQLQSGNATSYQWTGPNGFSSTEANPQIPNVTTDDSGVYTLTVTSAEGCSTSESVDVDVYMLPDVTLDLSDINPVNWNVDSIELTGGAPSGGTYSGTGVVGNWFYPSSAGLGEHEITYTYTNTDGCSDSATAMLEVFTSTNEFFSEDEWKIFPNPTNGLVTVIYEGTEEIETLELYDNLGKKVWFKSLKTTNFPQHLNFLQMPKGLYLLNLSSQKGTLVRKLIVF